MSKEDGGPAFPHDDFYEPVLIEGRVHKQKLILASSGMSLRDWFAGLALAEMCTRDVGGWQYELVAEMAYKHADAMLAERAKQ